MKEVCLDLNNFRICFRYLLQCWPLLFHYPHCVNIFYFCLTDYESFLAFSKVSGIETLHVFDEFNPNVPRPTISIQDNMRNVIGLAFDYKEQRYFFTDIQRGDIQSVGFDGTGVRVIVESK